MKLSTPWTSRMSKMALNWVNPDPIRIIAQDKNPHLQPLIIESCGPGVFGRESIIKTKADVLILKDCAKRGLGRGCA
ncbi:hypothetical protein [Prosthecobacter sp.]